MSPSASSLKLGWKKPNQWHPSESIFERTGRMERVFRDGDQREPWEFHPGDNGSLFPYPEAVVKNF